MRIMNISIKKKSKNSLSKKIKPVFILTFFILFFFAGEIFGKQVKIITYPYPPYIKGDKTGIAEKITVEAFEKAGHSAEFIYYPRKRSTESFYKKEAHVFLGVRDFLGKEKINVKEIFNLRRVLVYLKKRYPDFTMKSFDDLKGKTIGIPIGESQVPVFVSAGLKVDEATTVENNLRKLYAGRIDFWPTLDLTAFTVIEKIYPGKMSEFGFYEYIWVPGDLVVRKNHPEEYLYEDFKKGFDILLKTGRYMEILEEYYGKGTVPDSVPIKE